MWLTLSVAGVLAAVLAGCGTSVPADPEGTLDRVRDGILRVGVSPNPPWTELRDRADPTGLETELARNFATGLNAHIEWTTGGEQQLVDALEHGELDLLVGGLTKDSPWTEKVSLTRPYATTDDGRGGTEQHVMAVRMGENAFLVELETFLDDNGDQR
jgi:polar amino acid transport system substrate-binding protein